ncbi:hypothetical protein CCP3SC1_1500005 [Gammaproteobacteria bacterium]
MSYNRLTHPLHFKVESAHYRKPLALMTIVSFLQGMMEFAMLRCEVARRLTVHSIWIPLFLDGMTAPPSEVSDNV